VRNPTGLYSHSEPHQIRLSTLADVVAVFDGVEVPPPPEPGRLFGKKRHRRPRLLRAGMAHTRAGRPHRRPPSATAVATRVDQRTTYVDPPTSTPKQSRLSPPVSVPVLSAPVSSSYVGNKFTSPCRYYSYAWPILEALRSTPAGKRQARANDYLSAALWAERNLALLEGRQLDVSMYDRWMEGLRDCCTKSMVLKCFEDPTKTHPVTVHHCHQPGCAYCAAQRSRRLVKATEERIALSERRIDAAPGGGRSIKFMTLTHFDRVGELPRPARARLQRSIRLFRRTPEFKQNVFGGQTHYETTYNAERNSYHSHAHLLLDCKYWDKGEIQRAWQRVTGDSYVVDIREATKGAVLEACKYALKSIDFPPSQLVEYLRSMRGVRMVSTFGEWYRKGEDLEPCGEEEVPGEFELTDPQRLVGEELSGNADAPLHLAALVEYARENGGEACGEKLQRSFDVLRQEMRRTHELMLEQVVNQVDQPRASRDPP